MEFKFLYFKSYINFHSILLLYVNGFFLSHSYILLLFSSSILYSSAISSLFIDYLSTASLWINFGILSEFFPFSVFYDRDISDSFFAISSTGFSSLTDFAYFFSSYNLLFSSSSSFSFLSTSSCYFLRMANSFINLVSSMTTFIPV